MPLLRAEAAGDPVELGVALDARVVRGEVPRAPGEVLHGDVLELRALLDEDLDDRVRVALERRAAEAYSSITVNRLSGSATIEQPPEERSARDRVRDPNVERLLEDDALRDVDEQAVLPHRGVVRGELLVRADERRRAADGSSSGSKRIPSGARSISIPASPTVPDPATSSSSIVGAAATAVAPFAANASGSKPRRSVKRQGSSVVVGSGSAR